MMQLLMPSCLESLNQVQLLCKAISENLATQVEIIEFTAIFPGAAVIARALAPGGYTG